MVSKCFITSTLLIYCGKTTLDPEFLFCRQIHMIVIVFHVQGLLLTLFYIQVSSGFVKACQTRSKAFPSQTINFMDFWLITHMCQ